MKKRVVSLFLCVVMLVSLLSVNAFAATGVKLEAQKVETELSTNATVKVKVAITENSGIICGSYGVKWDSSALELTKVNFLMSNLPDAASPAIENNGEYWVSFGNDLATTNVTAKGDAFELVFKVLAGATAKEYPITIEPDNRAFRDTNANIVPPQAVNGSITLKAKTVAVTSVTVSPKTLDLEVGQKFQLAATVKPDEATDKTVTWKVTKGSDVVSVSADGEVTAIKAGSATITAAAGGKTATCTVTVKVPAHKHTPVAVPAQESTCMEKGWEAYYKCSECGAVVDENGNAAQIKYLPLAAHKLTETKAVPATCTEDGTEAYWTCSVCKKMFADKDGKKEIKAPVKVAALGHDIGEKTLETAGVAGSKLALYSATCKTCDKKVYTAMLEMPDNTLNVVAKQSDNSKKDFSKAVSFTLSTSKFLGAPVFTIDPVTADIVTAAKTKAGYKVAGKIDKADYLGAIAYELPNYYDTAEEAYAAMAAFMKDGLTFTQKISAKENTWNADAKSHTMTFDINTADGTFTVKVDGKNESTITFTNTFTYKTVSPGGGGSGSTTTDTTKTDGKKVESGKTFDAGIAMYVGLSVLSVTGGALVIGKKKERF
jgi:hypothetical protein